MNKAILIGNLTRDPEARTTSGGTPVTTFTLAINRRFTNSQGVREADFINIVTWRQTAELCARYLSKGRKVCVVGQIQSRSYDAQDGTKRYVTEVVADEVEFLGSREDGGAPRPRNEIPLPPEPAAPSAPAGGFTEVDDDELPF
ncbi:MAG: single-stranded DNA-binding protein [Clostridia bacterium]|nr:single-stranded DNA-binding protein [Clostridia bacterium]